jgi:dihydroneopterin aldolase/2-amino-4-hydroxy-6-hydroxymethyldihydropteridine diphosphokinase
MGDKKAFLDNAVTALQNHPKIKVLKVADYICTEPYGYTDQDEFLNSAVMLDTILPPLELLDAFQQIETDANRKRLIHWGPRTLDVDLLFYDDEILSCERLTVPHPEIEKRTFVLEPMVQLASWFRHPILHKTMQELLENLKAQEASHVSDD